MNEQKVSIFCAVFNHAKYLRKCLDGFVMQKTSFPFEALVHDDVSTDGSQDIIREYAEKYPDIIKPIYEVENQYSKHDGSINKLLWRISQGKYIAWCEGDDYWTDPLKLQKQVDILDRNADYSICFHQVETVNMKGESQHRLIPRNNGYLDKEIISFEDFLKELCYDSTFTFQVSSYLIRREYFEFYMSHIDDLFKGWPYSDVPYQISALMRGSGFFIKEPMSCYRVVDTGFSATQWDNLERRKIQEERELTVYSRLDDYLKGKYHQIIKYRTLRNSIHLETSYYQNLVPVLKPKYWPLMKFRTLRCNLSYLAQAIFQLLRLKKS